MRAIVTGGAGFIGSHLCRRLLQEGFEVFCLDNFFTGRRENVAALSSNPKFHLIEHDAVNPISIEAERIYLLACPASPVHYQADPIKTLHTSIFGTNHALELAQRCKARVLLASTSEIYGDPKEHPQAESYWGNVNPIGPRACYDEAKRVAETLLTAFVTHRKIEGRIVRIFNTYGPNMRPDDGRVVSNFIVQALQNKPITIYGDGSQTRSFCYVSDLVEGLYRTMERHLDESPVNLGNPNEFTIRELATEVSRLLGVELQLSFERLPIDDPTRRRPDITRAKTLLGWEPKIPLNEGLQHTIEYFKEQL